MGSLIYIILRHANFSHLKTNFFKYCSAGNIIKKIVAQSSYRLHDRGALFHVQARASDFSYLQSVQTGSGAHAASYAMRRGDSRPRRKAVKALR